MELKLNELLEKLKTENVVEISATYSPSIIVDEFKKLGFESEIDSNGWQHDFWITFENGTETYVLSGCWYYGTMMKLTKKEEDDE